MEQLRFTKVIEINKRCEVSFFFNTTPGYKPQLKGIDATRLESYWQLSLQTQYNTFDEI